MAILETHDRTAHRSKFWEEVPMVITGCASASMTFEIVIGTIRMFQTAEQVVHSAPIHD